MTEDKLVHKSAIGRLQNRLVSMQAVCDGLTATLRDEHADVQSLLAIEETLSGLAHGLEEGLHEYTHARGAAVQETVTARAGLTAMREDLVWVRRRHRLVPPADIRARLDHALHSTVSALSLLRWSLT